MIKKVKSNIAKKAFTQSELLQLMDMNMAIAVAKTANGILAAIREKAPALIPLDDAGILIVEKDGLHYYDMDDASSRNTVNNGGVKGLPYPGSYMDAVTAKIKKGNEPVIQDWPVTNDGLRDPFLSSMIALGLKQGVATLLTSGDKAYGVLWLKSLHVNHFDKGHFDLLEAIGAHVSVAVANILEQEEMVEKDAEKTSLLKISEAVAAIQNYKELLRVIYEVIQPVFPFDNTGLFILTPSEDALTEITDTDILNSTTTSVISDAKKLGPFSLKTFQKNSWIYSPLPIITSIAREVEFITNAFCSRQMNDNLEAGLQQMICGPLLTGGKKIGAIYLCKKETSFYNDRHLSLFKSLTDLIAVAVANILANEEIKAQSIEIDKLNKQLKAQNEYLIEEVEQQYNFEEMIGQNAAFKDVCRNIGLVAKTDSTVLILGETGTGKELVARAIHNNSIRKNKPLIKLNCAALPANLIESELFGHERGAFTGAFERRIGKFELANGSTLFLDELGELPLELQAKLLRALQEREIERLGSNKTLKIDVRIIAATNRELEKDVQAGKFRQDLFYRLNVFPVTLPPLRERKEDIPLLAAHFMERYAKKTGKKIQGFSGKAMQDMMSYNWPGNIRELEHVIERSVIITNAKLIPDLSLPINLKKRISASSTEFIIKTWEEHERDYILEVLKMTNGNMAGKNGAAELLQLPATTLQSKMKKLGIKRGHFVGEKLDTGTEFNQ